MADGHQCIDSRGAERQPSSKRIGVDGGGEGRLRLISLADETSVELFCKTQVDPICRNAPKFSTASTDRRVLALEAENPKRYLWISASKVGKQ